MNKPVPQPVLHADGRDPSPRSSAPSSAVQRTILPSIKEQREAHDPLIIDPKGVTPWGSEPVMVYPGFTLGEFPIGRATNIHVDEGGELVADIELFDEPEPARYSVGGSIDESRFVSGGVDGTLPEQFVTKFRVLAIGAS